MRKLFISLTCLLFCWAACARNGVLIVADEFPAMEALAQALKTQEDIDSRLVKQTEMPANLGAFSAVIVYIHLGLDAAAERAFITYANQGGKLVVLHHSISSGKRANKEWFPFLGIRLPQGELAEGGYHWTEGVSWQVVNRAPAHFITTHKVEYEGQTAYAPQGVKGSEQTLPCFTLNDSEVYLNHVWTGARTLLLGLRYQDRKSGLTYAQDTAGWCQPAGKGWVFYFMPGHSRRDFQHPAFARIVMNAIVFKP
jgi:hypothetical protein